MKQQLFIAAIALGLFAAPASQHAAQAQSLTIGRGGVSYNGFGRGSYGGYGRGYNGYYSGSQYRYRNYGNGPYGYGSGNSRMFPSRRSYGYGNRSYYNGYSYSGNYGSSYVPVSIYSPYGYGAYNSYSW